MILCDIFQNPKEDMERGLEQETIGTGRVSFKNPSQWRMRVFYDEDIQISPLNTHDIKLSRKLLILYIHET